MIVLDASLLIALLDDGDAHHAQAHSLLEDSTDPLAVSTLTLAEVGVGPARAGRLPAVHQAVAALDLYVVPLGSQDWESLAQLRASTGLRMPDCCVLQAAADRSAVVATFDRRLARAAGQAGLRVLGH